MAIMIGCIWHVGALQGTRAKPGNYLVSYILPCNAINHCIINYVWMFYPVMRLIMATMASYRAQK